MFTQQEIENILFLDVETAPVMQDYHDLPERVQFLWDKKARRYMRDDPDKVPEELFFEKAGIHAEFGRVVCISCAYLKFDEQGIPQIKMKSFYGEDEHKILEDFRGVLNTFCKNEKRNICAHNGKEFDFPFLARRYVIHGIEIPFVLQVQGKKPWEVKFVDSMELWKFGDYKAYTSLDLLSAILGIPSPKDDIDGSEVGKVYWYDKDHERIKIYCEKDVQTTAQVLLRMSRLPLIPEEEGTEGKEA